MASHGLLGTLGHAAHDVLHVAAHVALLQRFPFVDEDHRARFYRIVNVQEGNAVRLFQEPGATVFAGKRLDQSSLSQREQQPAHDDRIGIYACGERPRIDHFSW